ncbi:SRPBCC family protein [Mariprofundus ferrooxydans]|nr:SRPBCC family protein [Mariprofundus ferrooxydans]
MPLSKLEASIKINRPIADVIAFVDDNTNDPMWQSSVLESEKKSDGEPVVGTVYYVREKFLGRVIEQEWVITERNADGSYWAAKSTTGAFPMEATMAFEGDGESTVINRTLSIDVGRFFKVASPVVGHIANREMKNDFENLKELLEAEA